jgi:uncharacterized protein YhjY with autotransporter beta-barrel domain
MRPAGGTAAPDRRQRCEHGSPMLRPTLIAGLLGTAASMAFPMPAAAQSCSTEGSQYLCSANGNFGAPIQFSQQASQNPDLPMQAAISGNLSYNVPSSANAALQISAYGYQPGSGPGGNSSGITINNSAPITLNWGAATVNDDVFGIWGQQTAGTGAGPGQNGGSTTSLLSLNNSGNITFNLAGEQALGGAGIRLADQGGQGTPDTSDAAGGNSVGATVSNQGEMYLNLYGSQGIAGIQALSTGGDGGLSNSGSAAGNGGNGGWGGLAAVSSSVQTRIDWTWQNAGAINNGLWGVQAYSQGGAGGRSNDGNGGAGGASGLAAVQLTAGANVYVGINGTPPSMNSALPSAGVLAATIGGAGGYGQGNNGADGGNGGDVSGGTIPGGNSGTLYSVVLSMTDASVGVGPIAGVVALAQGGAGSTAGSATATNNAHSSENAGNGGSVNAGAIIDIGAQTQPVTIQTDGGNQAAAVLALMQGGAGGIGGAAQDSGLSDSRAGTGGFGGSVNAALSVNLSGSRQTGISLITSGTTSPGIYAASIGGAGADGGDASTGALGSGYGGAAGSGGNGGNVNVSVAYTSIATQADTSPGIVVLSQGGIGGSGGAGDTGAGTGYGGAGANGGASGNVGVSVDGNSTISTNGTDAVGILAQSVGASGGGGGSANGDTGVGGASGVGGTVGAVTVSSGATITTKGSNARGILAQSIAGSGGGGGGSWGLWQSSGASGATGTAANSVTVTNSGVITTSGSNAEGILLQSIGGAGGAGGAAAGVIANVGGSGAGGSGGGAVTYNSNNGSSISTGGTSAIGVLGQSIGGGGGDGGGASGIAVSIGGNGSSAAGGGTVAASLNSSSITTTGDGAFGLVMQSIGGGGGNGGNASAAAPFASVTIGGTGAGGGAGGQVTVSLTNTAISTAGTKSPGLVAQSIGGGGGTGGNAASYSIGAGVSASVAVGGNGGAGNTGGLAAVTMTGGSIMTGQDSRLLKPIPATAGGCSPSNMGAMPCNTLPVDSYGAVVQSIGGGGGLGGSAVAQAVAVSTPVSSGGDQVAIAAAVTVGGKGGTGADGGTAQFSLSNGASIETRGNGSTGVLVQSIGGGGGAGGDSSSMAAVLGYPESTPTGSHAPSATLEFTMGGSAGIAGDGGTVNVALGGIVSADGTTFTGDTNAQATSITTYGDFADGVKAQSIGGGGGDAGVGSGNTQSFGTGTSSSIGINLGSSGGAGGNGGNVMVNMYAGNGITTSGSGAMGILAQSVGGGGGTSQGGSYSVAQSGHPSSTTNNSLKLGVTLNLGTTGSGGGSGGDVTVNVGAPITTGGADATGVLAQSVGGGGGVGGAAGSDGSGDSPIVKALAGNEYLSDINNALLHTTLPQTDVTLAMSFGGSGGQGGAGSTATANLGAPIITTGDWANGIVAQSIGGGGGKGGTGVAHGTGGVPEITINLDMAFGGTGGSGGNGGAANVSFGNGASVSTGGFGASGVVVQSVGGGGGMAADGSDSASGRISVGMAGPGTGGAAGDGGAATFYYGAGNPTVSTSGDLADGIVVQSIGGGGGIAGAGSTSWVNAGGVSSQGSAGLNLTAGGAGPGGNGGSVNFAQNNTALTIQTTGVDAFGVLAQSVGGGGGIINTAQMATPTIKLGGSSVGDGGSVTVTTTTSTSITTTGPGSIGVLAQSVGGGGGIIRVAGDGSAVTGLVTGANAAFAQQSSPGTGNGGTVQVALWGPINVQGAGSIGLFAQSVGGGGGLVMSGNTLYAGTPLQYTCTSPCGGAAGLVNIVVEGPISASGPNGIGIFAQAAGYAAETQSNPDLQIHNSVTGGTGAGAVGVAIDNQQGANTYVNVYPGASISTGNGVQGNAVIETGQGLIYLQILTGGTVTGSAFLNSGSIFSSGLYYAGQTVDADVFNEGSFNLVDPDMTSHVTGQFIQGSEGKLGVTFDSLNNRASQLRVDGHASIDGTIVPSAVSLLPGELPIGTAGSLDMTATAKDSLLFDWEARRSGNTVLLNPKSADFRPAGVALNDSQSSLGNYFGRGWGNSDRGLAVAFAGLSRINDGGEYKSALNSLSSKATQAQSMALVNEAGTILGSSMSCPVFVGDSVQLGEGSCVWGQFSGRWSDQSRDSGMPGYHVSGTTYRLGGQREISPGWYLGGSAATGQTWARMDGGSNGDGNTYDGSLTLKRVDGPWYFAGSLAMASGSFHTNRHVELPGVNESLSSSPNIFMAGARLRAGYEFGFDRWYIKPYNDIDIVHTHLPGFKESGNAAYALNVRGDDQTNVVVSPMLEFGMRRQVDAKTSLRAYAAFGASWRPDSDRSIQSSVAGASSATGTFTDYIKSPEVLGKVDVGVQFFRVDGFEMKASYTADIGHSFLSQTASARFVYHF